MDSPAPHAAADSPLLELFLCGSDELSAAAEAAVRQVARRLALPLELRDVSADHEFGRERRVHVTPTLVLLGRDGERRVFGDLEDPEAILRALQAVAACEDPLERDPGGGHPSRPQDDRPLASARAGGEPAP